MKPNCLADCLAFTTSSWVGEQQGHLHHCKMRHLPANHSMLMQYQPQKQLIFCLAVPHLDDFSSQLINRNQSKSINQPKKSIYFKGQITNQNSSLLNKHQLTFAQSQKQKHKHINLGLVGQLLGRIILPVNISLFQVQGKETTTR